MLYGLPGTGKTSLAQIVSNEIGANFIISSGQAFEKTGDVASILAGLKPGDILFIDEVHRLKPKIEELLYTAMEDYAIDIVLGKGPTAKLMRLDLPPFTLIGATTQLHKIGNPLKDRFGLVLKLEDYVLNDIIEILRINAVKLEVILTEEALRIIASSARATPRLANHLLKRARDFMIHMRESKMDKNLAEIFLTKLGIDQFGLNEQDRKIVSKIHLDFANGPVGLSTLCASLNEDQDNMQFIYEPFLIRQGLIKRTHKGRQLTSRGIEFARNGEFLN